MKTQGGARSGSLIHGGYSNWHYGLRERDEKYKILYLSDIDRLWIEVDPKSQRKIVGVIDIKYKGAFVTFIVHNNREVAEHETTVEKGRKWKWRKFHMPQRVRIC